MIPSDSQAAYWRVIHRSGHYGRGYRRRHSTEVKRDWDIVNRNICEVPSNTAKAEGKKLAREPFSLVETIIKEV